ncbi:cation:proton antiporter [Gordonia sp. NB41Y]|uniref:cation:proton antiporter n=1 Tax=Gordonia sp. NB41Y TaxID=875808 RepID=UPI0002C005A7|nr:cation:proton antiporter [Gordonia sp. NB41Y]EMP13965.1 transporter [Gordonia sp. NB41Y]WLP90002.1 cation:proton antiporter [Gordonia sp. NB41Y]
MIVLAEATSEASSATTLFWIAVAAVLAPLVARLTRRYVPEVVVLLVLGMLVGPYVLDVADPGSVAPVSQLGLGMLFLLAGFELDSSLLRGRTGAVAGGTWLVSLVIATVVLSLLVDTGDFTAHVAIAIAMTSTALGTLLPILKADGLLRLPLGRSVMAHGAIGELGPILAMSLLLTSRNLLGAVIVLVLFAIAVVFIARVPQHAARVPGLRSAITEMDAGTFQLSVRVVILLLASLMAVAAVFDLDVVLGAFAAGLILRRLIPEGSGVAGRLEVIGFGLLIPVFFVTSGMNIDPGAVAQHPGLWAILVVGIGVARGVPVWVSERFVGHAATPPDERQRVQVAFYAATGLPIIVAVTSVAVDGDLMSAQLASIMVAAGATTVLIFPLVARLLTRKDSTAVGDTDSDAAASDGQRY